MKKLLSAILALIAYPMLALPAYADTLDPCSGAPVGSVSEILCKITSDNANTMIQNVIIFIVVIAVIIALIYLLYGGIKWVTSGGDKEKVESARNHITAAIVGLIIVFLAIFIISILLTLFGLEWGNLKIPSLQGGTEGAPAAAE